MSKTEWTQSTWNPTIGCEIVSPGCAACYVMRQARRLEKNPVLKPNPYKVMTKATKAGPVWTGLVRMAPDKTLRKPLSWKKPRLIFVNSMSDVFAEPLRRMDIAKIFAVMALGKQHTFQVLTKRPHRMLEFMANPNTRAAVELQMQALKPGSKMPGWPLENVWLGTSTEDQTRLNERLPILLKTPAAVRFLSIEPLLGSIRLWRAVDHVKELKGLDWVIVGGESGNRARPMHPVWASSLQSECRSYRIRFFFKQVGSWQWVKDGKASEFLGVLGGRSATRQDINDQGILKGSKKDCGRKLDGKLYEEMPAVFDAKRFNKAA